MKPPAAREPRLLSEGRYRITGRPDGALVIAWFPGPGDGDEGGGVVTLPAPLAALLARLAAGDTVKPADALRLITGALRG